MQNYFGDPVFAKSLHSTTRAQIAIQNCQMNDNYIAAFTQTQGADTSFDIILLFINGSPAKYYKVENIGNTYKSLFSTMYGPNFQWMMFLGQVTIGANPSYLTIGHFYIGSLQNFKLDASFVTDMQDWKNRRFRFSADTTGVFAVVYFNSRTVVGTNKIPGISKIKWDGTGVTQIPRHIYFDSSVVTAPAVAPNEYHWVEFVDFDIDVPNHAINSVPDHFIGCMENENDGVAGNAGRMRIALKSPTFTVGQFKDYVHSFPGVTFKCKQVYIEPSSKDMFMIQRIQMSTFSDDYLIQLSYDGVNNQLKLQWVFMHRVTSPHHFVKFVMYDYSNLKFLYAMSGQLGSSDNTFTPPNDMSGVFLMKFKYDLSNAFPGSSLAECRDTRSSPMSSFGTGHNVYSSANLLFDGTSWTTLTLDTGYQMTDNLSNLQLSDLNSISNQDPSYCPGQRDIVKYPPVIEPVIYYITNQPTKSVTFIPDSRNAGLSTCDKENMQYIVMPQVQGTPMPPNIVVVQSGGTYAVQITMLSTTYSPSQNLLKLCLVDNFRQFTCTDFILYYIDNVPTECTGIQLYPPVMSDQLYIIGDTNNHVVFSVPNIGYSTLTNTLNCADALTFYAVLYKGTSTTPYTSLPSFIQFSSHYQSISLFTENLKDAGSYILVIHGILRYVQASGTSIPTTKSIKINIKLVTKSLYDQNYCKIVPPPVQIYNFGVATVYDKTYEVGTFGFSSQFCENYFVDSRDHEILFEIYLDTETTRTLLNRQVGNMFIQDCYQVYTIGQKLYLDVSTCPTVKKNSIRVEAWVGNSKNYKPESFRALSVLTMIRFFVTADLTTCNDKMFAPKEFTKSYGETTIYHDVTGLYNFGGSKATFNPIDRFKIDPTCASTVSYLAHYNSQQDLDLASTSTNLFFFDNIGYTLNVKDTATTNNVQIFPLRFSAVHPSSSLRALYMVYLILYSSYDCEIYLDRLMQTQYTLYVYDKSITSVKLRPMSIGSKCMYKSLFYDLHTQDGSLPRFLTFLGNPLQQTVYVTPPSEIEIGTYVLIYRGYANPQIEKKTEIYITVKSTFEKLGNPGNRAPPAFNTKLENQVMYAESKYQYSLPTRSDMDGNKITCIAYFDNGSDLPVWVQFKKTTCSFIFIPSINEKGLHRFIVELKDDNPAPLSQNYTFTLKVEDTELNMLKAKQEALARELAKYSIPYKITKISEVGVVTLKFSYQMNYTQNLTLFGMSHLDMSLIKAGSEVAQSQNWTVISYSNKTNIMKMQLYFEDPYSISTSQQKDILRVQFLRSKFFQNAQTMLWADAKTKTDIELNQQMDPSLLGNLEKSLSQAESVFNSLIAGNMFLNIVMQELILIQMYKGLHHCKCSGA